MTIGEDVNLAVADLSQIPMSPMLASTLARASDGASASGAAEVSLEHVLMALCDDPDAIAVLDASRVDIARLRHEAGAYLTHIGAVSSAGQSSGFGVSLALRRILEAAGAAARGGRRRDINGAIVLAAIVGDGRSVAAQMLQAQGMTFDEAIRALQMALSQREPLPDTAPAEDVLARARERVQSRAAPTLRDIMKDMPKASAPPPPMPTSAPMPSSEQAPAPNAGVMASLRKIAGEDESAENVENKPALEPAGSLAAEAEQAAEEALPSPEVSSPEAAPDLADSPSAASVPDAALAPSPVPAAPEAAPQQPMANDGGYTYPADRPMTAPAPGRPFGAPPNPFEAPVTFDLGRRPAPQAMPPPIPPSGPFSGPFPGPYPGQHPSHQLGRGAPNYPQPQMPRGQPMPPVFSPQPPGSPAPPLGPNSGASGGMFGGTLGGPMGAPPSGLQVPRQQAPQARKREAPAKGAKAKAEAGQLAENIPRSMRVARTERVEIRIAKANAKAITDGLEGGGVAWRHDVTVTQAMSVRLRAPEGGFFIETVSPETQWIENHLGFASDDFASWRFLVTPQSRGWARLQIVVSARTIGGDGMAAETALPDQVVEVKVRTNFKRTLARWTGWTIAAVGGGALAKFGETGLEIANIYIQKFMH